MGLLNFIVGQGIRSTINTIRRNSQNVPPKGTVIHPRVVSDGKRLVTGPEAQKILQEQEAQKINASASSNRMVWDPTSRRFILNASTPDNTVTQSNPVKPEDKKIITETPTYHVGGLNISDGIQQGIGLTPKVDMLGLTKSPTTNLETTTPQPDYMRFVNPVMPYVQNYFRAQNNTTKFPMKELPVEGLTFNKVYNKKDTRQWLWDQGIDPYTLTGRQRRKIRNDLNATGTTNFKINGVTPIVMKKGSKLIKKEEVCPKCGKIHKAGIGCTIAKFRYDNGGSLNRIPFYQGGTPKGGINSWKFSKGSVGNLGNGYSVVNHWIYQDMVNGQNQGDFPPTVAGRTIYTSPYRSDTIYWRNLDSDQDFLNEKVPTGSANQRSAKQNFYNWVKKAKPTEGSESSYRRARQGK